MKAITSDGGACLETRILLIFTPLSPAFFTAGQKHGDYRSLLWFKGLFILIIWLYMYLCGDVCVSSLALKTRKRHPISWNSTYRQFWAPITGAGSQLSSLEEQQVVLTVKPSLQPHIMTLLLLLLRVDIRQTKCVSWLWVEGPGW